MSDQVWPYLLFVGIDPPRFKRIDPALRQRFDNCRMRVVSAFAEFADFDLSCVDLIVLQTAMPDASAEAILEHCLNVRPDIPVIVLTEPDAVEQAIALIDSGAFDMVVDTESLGDATAQCIERNLSHWKVQQDNRRLYSQLRMTLSAVQRKNDQLEQAVAKLEATAGTDPLTSLANRRAFNRVLERSFAECNRYGRDLACIMIDLDGFKQLNDTLGHQRGDELLQRVGRVLDANCRRSDLAGRFGGDEFIVLLPEADIAEASRIARRVSEEFLVAISPLLEDAPDDLNVTMSMGIATLAGSRAGTPEQLIAFADHALYRAKQTGKSKAVVYDRSKDKAPNRATSL